MRQLIIILCLVFALSAVAQNEVKRIAILETVDRVGDVNLGVKNLLRQSITFGINRIAGYEGYNRVDMAQITGEHNFQRTGYVSDADIKKLGQMTGAQYVLIAEATTYDDSHILVFANLVDVESGRITNSSIPKVAGIAPKEMYEDCAEVAQTLLGISISKTSKNNSTSPSLQSVNQDYIEDAWGINMKMIWVEGGDFLMGCTAEQDPETEDMLQFAKSNIRRVRLDSYYISAFEITQDQWEKVMGTSVNQLKDGGGLAGVGVNYPMYYVDYEDAMAFCRQLSKKTGKNYALPSEAQWEYAARGGNKSKRTKYSGSNVLDEVAWTEENSRTAHECGTKKMNELGIYDMSGNVWEWCRDRFAYSYDENDVDNPTGPSSGDNRVVRGGSWYCPERGCQVSYRSGSEPTWKRYDVGFRVVLLP